MRQPALGEQELEVLRYVAENGPLSVGQVAESYGVAHGYARSTILTVMERLRKKTYLQRSQQDGVYLYASTAAPSEMMRGLVSSFVRRVLAGSLSPFVAYLAESDEVSDTELAELHEMVARLESKRKQANREE